jgi:hypothetical protein
MQNYQLHFFDVCNWYSEWAVECAIQDFIPGRYKRIFASPKQPDSFSNSPHLLYRGSYPGTKAKGPNVDCSPQSGAKVKNEWSYTCAPPYMPSRCVQREFYIYIFVTM